ncbi:hypothetical protein [Pseudoalteromonas sp. S558]|uniref:hypothetical protein n=1 Tax=Pseudoalteromonas sp. S558 TaxID=2066515 RepID=UPI00110AE691|nr:hypothetical protein [Pseudoalteromonas sp. S558]TMN95122.1 hypothetical protein CWB66_18755 [Pseudoalteromonas sp. S558]
MNNEAWNKYVDCFRKNFDSCVFKDELINVCGGYDDVACAVFFHTQSNAIKWMSSKLPALENKIPSQEIGNGNVISVRKVIMRMPC